MPYVPKEYRPQFVPEAAVTPRNPGGLNFQLSVLLIQYVAKNGLSYDTINDISGAMTEALAEFRRRVVVPYENQKIAANGDIYASLTPLVYPRTKP